MDTEPADSRPSPERTVGAWLDVAEPSTDPAGPVADPPPLDLDDLDDLGDDGRSQPAPVLPPVVAVVVTDGGAGLEATLGSLVDQEYPSLSTLVIDRGAETDPTARVAAVYPHAFVRRLEEPRSFTEACNVAFASVEGSTFFIVCRDDVVIEPGAVRVLVEEAYRSNAAIVGPKVVELDRPDVLLEVGLSVDRYGVVFSDIEPGEVDQEQHDAVRDVFCVSDAFMLLRADIVAELGGFDPRAEPGSADLDLCWRARIVGARVVVAPDARVRRHATGGHRRARLASARRDANRARIRVLAKCTARGALFWVLPLAFLLDAGEAVGLALGRRFTRARSLMSGWWSALRELPSTISDRRPVQSKRRVGEHELRALMVRGSSRVRTALSVRLHGRSGLDLVETRTRSAVGSARATLRGAGGIAWVAVLAVVLIGSRNLIATGVPSVGGFATWPHLGALLRTYHSTWRTTGLGSASPASASFGVMSIVTAVLFGHAALARMLLVVGSVPLGGYGVYRALRRATTSPLPAIAGLVAYVGNPLPRNLLGSGQLGPLVLFALAPFVLSGIAHAVGDHWSTTDPDHAWRWTSVVGVGALVAVTTAFWPPALLLALSIGAVALVGAPLLGGLRAAAPVAAAAAAATVGALLLLVPWPLALLHADGPSLGLLPRPPLPLGDLLRFHTGASGAGLLPWGLLVAAALPLITASGDRLLWAGRAWLLVAASFALAWLPSRLSPSLSVPAPGGVLVGAALGLAIAVGIGVAAFVEELRTLQFGWRQVGAIVAVCGLLAPVPGALGDALGGSWHLPGGDWNAQLSWMSPPAAGSFRVLWLGDPPDLPLDGAVTHGLGYGLSRNGPPDARALWPAPGGRAGSVVRDAVALLATARTARLGHVLAPLGVRYIAVIDRAAPGAHPVHALPASLSTTLGEQLDLSMRQTEAGLTLYENAEWVPTRAVTSALPSGGDPTADALASNVTARPLAADRSPGSGTLFVSEAHDSRWRATQGGRALADSTAFGWANAYPLRGAGDSGAVRVRFHGGSARTLALVGQLLLWLALVGFLVAARRRRAPAKVVT